ncbi:hypothetical protein Ancab_010263 [Ancistrocladus abbreviatus]
MITCLIALEELFIALEECLIQNRWTPIMTTPANMTPSGRTLVSMCQTKMQSPTHVSSTACSFARIFMVEGTTNLQRSKKSDHADTSSVALTLEDKIASTSMNFGPHSQWPMLPLDKNLAKPQKPKTKTSKPSNKATLACHRSKSRPSSPRAICTQPTEIISKSKKKGPTKKSSKAPSKKGITHPNHSHANVEQIQVESLHDSNIAKMNKIFLNNLSQVTAAEI